MALKTTVKELKHQMYDAEEAEYFGRKRNSFDKKRSNKAERKNVKQYLEDYYDADDYFD